MNTPGSHCLPALRATEIEMIHAALRDARGNQRKAARLLKISRWSLVRRMRAYGIDPHGYRHQPTTVATHEEPVAQSAAPIDGLDA